MSQRLLLTMGVVGLAAAVVVGAFGMSTTALGFSMIDRFGGSNGTMISMDQAQQSVQSFIDRTGNKDLQIDELMQFDHNFYGLVKERSTGIGAFEVLVNKHSGSVSFEPGPDMMWNTKYSIMGRMGITGGAWMGGSGLGGLGTGGYGGSGPGMQRPSFRWPNRWLGDERAGYGWRRDNRQRHDRDRRPCHSDRSDLARPAGRR